jgi:hypothetical protein
MEHPESVPTEDGQTLISPLQQTVLAWMDGDRVLPADGAALLEGLTGAKGAAARHGIEAFIDRVQALIDAGLLDAAAGRLALETAGDLRKGERG